MKQTALEWLYDQIENKGKCIYEVIDQARAMEKEQIFKVYFHGWSNGIQGNFISQEEYYIENFKSQTK